MHRRRPIIYSPPLLGFAECLQIATAADGVLIVNLAGETRHRAVAEVISVLNRLRANIVGVVLNQVSQNTSSDGYSYLRVLPLRALPEIRVMNWVAHRCR